MKTFLLTLLLLSVAACDKISPNIGTNERGLLAGTIPAVLGYDNEVKFIEKIKSPLFPWEKLELIDIADKNVSYSYDEKLRPNSDAPIINCKVSYRVRDTKEDLLSFRSAFYDHAAFAEYLQTLLQDRLLKMADLDEILFSNTEPLREALAKDVSGYGVELTELSIAEFFDEKAINAEKQAVSDLERKVAELKETLSQKREGLSSEHSAQVTALQNRLVSAEVEADLIKKKADNSFEAKKKAAEATLETGRLRLKELEEVAGLLSEK